MASNNNGLQADDRGNAPNIPDIPSTPNVPDISEDADVIDVNARDKDASRSTSIHYTDPTALTNADRQRFDAPNGHFYR
jgi:hypothetical protein